MNIDHTLSQVTETRQSRLRGFLIAGALAALAGCSSGPPPTGQLAAAHSAIEQATPAGREERAAAQLAAARDKYARAERAVQLGNNQDAIWLAEEAQADAQLAMSLSQVARQQEVLEEMRETTRAMME